MVGVMVGPHDEACELAAVVVRAVNAANAAVRGTQAQESVSDEVAALTARLAAAEAERDAACQQVALLRRLIHQHGITWFDPPKVTIDRLQAERDALTEHLLHRHRCDFGLAHAPVADADEEPPDGR
jgi:hypothetical protein